jgi:hypothetical protein
MSSTQVKKSVNNQPVWNNSIFIPAVHFDITKNQMKEEMEKNIGKVHRVDFVGFNSENGAGRRAFVHFSNTYQNPYVKGIRNDLETKGYADVNYGKKMMWRLMPNKNPVPETDQTIQQVASNIDFISEKIKIHEEVMLRQNEMYLDLQKKMDAMEENQIAHEQYMENLLHYTKRLEHQILMMQSMPIPMPIQPYYLLPPPVPVPMQFAPHFVYPDSSCVDECEKSEQMPYTFFEEADMEFEPSDFEEDTQGKMSICDLV